MNRKLALDPRVRCTLELDGRTVEIASGDLGRFLELLPERDLGSAPAGDLVARLFRSGMIAPVEVAPPSPPSAWRERLPSLALSPFLALSPTLAAGSSRPNGIEAPIAAFLDPGFVKIVTELAAEIRDGVYRAGHVAAVRGIALRADEGLALLHDLAQIWLDAHPEAKRWLRWERRPDGALELAVVDGARVSSQSPAFTTVSLRVGVPGKARAVDPRDVLVPLRELASLARVLDALRDAVPAASVAGDLELASVRRALDAIEAVGGLVPRRHEAPSDGHAAAEPGPRMSRLAAVDGPGVALAVTHLGHAALLVEGGGRRVLVDPWLFPWDEAYEEQPPTLAELGRVDAIAFTHHHEDHMDPGSLLLLPHDVPVLVARDTGRPLGARTPAYLRLMGFDDVRELSPGDRFDAGGGLTIEAVPFYGEASDRLGWDATCFAASRHGRSALLHADAAPDGHGRSLLATGALADLRARLGPGSATEGRIDVVFGTWWQEREFACAVSPLAIVVPSASASAWLDVTERCDCPPEFVAGVARAAGAKLVVLYAESGRECFLPRNRVSGYLRAVSFLWKGIDAYRARVREAGAELEQAQPYLRVVLPATGDPYLDDAAVAPSRRAART